MRRRGFWQSVIIAFVIVTAITLMFRGVAITVHWTIHP